jgi:hypothetical protein
MKIGLSCLILALACSRAQAADCVYPREPSSVPNGKTASKEEMMAGMTAVKEYNNQMTTYLACLDEQMNAAIASAGPEAKPDLIERIKTANAKRHNDAVATLEAHAARFNEEVRAFKSRDKDPKKS